MMKFILLRLTNLFDNKKDRAYVSKADKILQQFDRDNPQKSESQKKEFLKHKDIYKRKRKLKKNFIDGE